MVFKDKEAPKVIGEMPITEYDRMKAEGNDQGIEEILSGVSDGCAQISANLKQLREDNFLEEKKYIIETSGALGQYNSATLRYQILKLNLLHDQTELQRENNDLLRTVVRQQEELISLQRTRTCNCKK